MSIKQINDTTFSADGLGDVKPSVLIGGKATDKFIPNVNTSFYDDEFYFNLNAVDCEVIDEAVSADDVLRQNISGQTHEYYIDDNGRLKWDKLFYSCPDSMRVRFKVKKSSGINFYYQPELTAEEIADGCERPDDIVGSYAVYCDKANNKYKTGKLCHIPRPFVIDAHGNREWCVMTYEEIRDTEGMLYIDMPEEFMQSAVYPVRLDPTIGYTTAGGSSYAKADFSCQNYNITMPESGTAYKVWGYSKGNGTAHDLLLGLYADNSGVPGNAIELNLAVSVTSTSPAWYSYTLSGSSLSSGNKYYPALLCPARIPGGNTSYNSYYYDTSSGTNVYYKSNSRSMPSPAGTLSSSTIKVSVYLEYTKSGGGSGNSYYYQQQQM